MGMGKKTGEGSGVKQRDTAAEGLSPLIPVPTCVCPSSTSGSHFPAPHSTPMHLCRDVPRGRLLSLSFLFRISNTPAKVLTALPRLSPSS